MVCVSILRVMHRSVVFVCCETFGAEFNDCIKKLIDLYVHNVWCASGDLYISLRTCVCVRLHPALDTHGSCVTFAQDALSYSAHTNLIGHIHTLININVQTHMHEAFFPHT